MASFNSKSIFRAASKSDIIKIITVTSMVYVILQFTRVTFLISNESDAFFWKEIYNRMALPPTFGDLLYQPWSLITYLFSELNFMRLLGNMIWLWIFGTVIEDLKGSNRILPVYLTGGIIGALLMLGYNSISGQVLPGHYAGALSALSAVAMATLMFKPKYQFSMFFGLRIPIWIFILIFFALTVLTIQQHNIPLFFLALGGILTGVLYTNFLHPYFEKTTEVLTRIGNYFSNNENYILKKESRVRNQTLRNFSYKSGSKGMKTIDEILDKINEKGMESLSKEEKKQLEEYSKNA